MKSIFKDKDGNTMITQTPNAPLIVWFVSSVLLYIPIHDKLTSVLSLVAFGSIFTWAWLELTSGVNTFRRILGASVLLVVVISRAY
ncbi:MAG: hypothetical protein O2794_01890 [bacterium]|nr:hypothetical protein [bacterium]